MSDNKKGRIKSLVKTVLTEAVSEDVSIPADKLDSMDMDAVADMSDKTNVVIEAEPEAEASAVPYSAEDITKSLWQAYTTHVDAINLKGETPHGYDFELRPNATLTQEKALEISNKISGVEAKDIGGVQFSMGDLFEVENVYDLNGPVSGPSIVRVRYKHVR